MKIYIALIFLCLCGCSTTTAPTPTPSSTAALESTPDPKEQAETQIRKTYDALDQAFQNLNIAKIAEFAASDHHFLMPDGSKRTLSEHIRQNEALFEKIRAVRARKKTVKVSSSTEITKTELHFGKKLVVFCKGKTSFVSSRCTFDTLADFKDVWVRKGDGWECSRSEILSTETLIDGKPVTRQLTYSDILP